MIAQKITRLWPTREDFRRIVAGGAARHRPRLGARRAAGRRRDAELVRRLCAGEEGRAADPARFGHGAVEGVAGPESANNAGAQTSFIPMLTLGIPGNAVMALMIGALTIHGIQPGPQIMTERPEMFWGMIASMWIGNLMLVIINLPLIGIWVQLLRVPVPLSLSRDPAVLRDRRLHGEQQRVGGAAGGAVRRARLRASCGSNASRRR